MKRLAVIGYLLSGILNPAFAGGEEVISKIENYLAKITTIEADFVQLSPEGEQSSGDFYLSRPGKMRWEYQPPEPILMVANNGTLAYLDRELNQLTHLSLEDTPLGLLTQKNLNLQNNPDIKILHVEDLGGFYKIELRQTKQEDDSFMRLSFAKDKMKLVVMEIIDPSGAITRVEFSNIKENSKLADELFKLPRKDARRR
jgi:outer membrane lipoprotein-sorting protein